VREIVAMGGSVAVGGNVTAAAEFNIFVDPEAAACVLAAGLPLTMVPLDVTHQVVWPASRIARLAARTDRFGRFAHAVAGAGLRLGQAAGEPGLVMHDPLTVGVALDPTLVETASLPVAVETAGTLTRGMTVADRRPVTARRRNPPTCRVALRVDAGRFLDLYEARVCGASA
jgi:inosine-uridine nucleoside N-ribohydrolase